MKVCDCVSCQCKAAYECYRLQCYCCKVVYVHRKSLERVVVGPGGAIFFGTNGTPQAVVKEWRRGVPAYGRLAWARG